MLASASYPVGVSLAGIAPQMENILRFFFTGPYKSKCEIVPHHLARISIVDVDDHRGRQFLDSCQREHPERSLILLSFNGAAPGNDITLPKPLRQDALIEALEQILERLPAAVVSAPEQAAVTVAEMGLDAEKVVEKAVDKVAKQAPVTEAPAALSAEAENTATALITPRAAMAAAVEGAGYHYPDERLIADYIAAAASSHHLPVEKFYDPGRYLQGYLSQLAHEADLHQHPVRLSLPGGDVMVLPAPVGAQLAGHRTLVNMRPEVLRDISSRVLDGEQLSVALIQGAVDEASYGQTAHRTLDELLWETATWASAGRLPRGSQPNGRVQLRRWPNLTRFMLLPDSLRIAALWLDHAISLAGTRRMLGVPVEHVYAFYSAADALGLVVHHAVNAPVTAPPELLAAGRQNSGILGRILNRLRSN